MKGAIWGAALFLALAIGCLAWHAFAPGDQLILLSLFAIPADILIFALAPPSWSYSEQAMAIATLGTLQWGLAGYLLSVEPGSDQ